MSVIYGVPPPLKFEDFVVCAQMQAITAYCGGQILCGFNVINVQDYKRANMPIPTDRLVDRLVEQYNRYGIIAILNTHQRNNTIGGRRIYVEKLAQHRFVPFKTVRNWNTGNLCTFYFRDSNGESSYDGETLV